jgi:hypothetical protein
MDVTLLQETQNMVPQSSVSADMSVASKLAVYGRLL